MKVALTIAFGVVLAILMTFVWAFVQFFLSSEEEVVLLGLALLVAFLIARKMKRESNPEIRFVRIFHGILGVFLALSIWSIRGPSKARLLERHLSITNSSEFYNIRTDYQSGREWTAWIYLEGSRDSIEQLLSAGGFKHSHEQALIFAPFEKAPRPPAPSDTRTYWRRRPGVMDYAITGPGSTQLWFTVHRL